MFIFQHLTRGGQTFDQAAIRMIPAHFTLQISNPSDRIAHHLRVLVYDARTASYFWSEEGIEAIGQSQAMALLPSLRVDQEEALKRLHAAYQDSDELIPQLAPAGRSFLALFFRDIENRLYLVKREFEFDHDRPQKHLLSHLYCAKED